MSVVYFVRGEGTMGPVKIGVTVDLPRRLHIGASWSPIPLEVITTIPGDKVLEHRIHALLEADHIHCEWFAWSPRMEALLVSIANGTFNHEGLPAQKYVGLRKSMRKWVDSLPNGSAKHLRSYSRDLSTTYRPLNISKTGRGS